MLYSITILHALFIYKFSFALVSYNKYGGIGESWSCWWACVVEKMKFGAKMGVGHWIGHMDDESSVGRVVCIKHHDFDETNRNANYLSAVYCFCHPLLLSLLSRCLQFLMLLESNNSGDTISWCIHLLVSKGTAHN